MHIYSIPTDSSKKFKPYQLDNLVIISPSNRHRAVDPHGDLSLPINIPPQSILPVREEPGEPGHITSINTFKDKRPAFPAFERPQVIQTQDLHYSPFATPTNQFHLTPQNHILRQIQDQRRHQLNPVPAVFGHPH